MIGGMDAQEWFSSTLQRRVTVVELAGILGVSRTTMRAWLDDGLSADHLVKLARTLRVNPAIALVELGYLEPKEVMEFVESGGQLLDTADEAQLSLELARRLNPVKRVNDALASNVRPIRARRNVPPTNTNHMTEEQRQQLANTDELWGNYVDTQKTNTTPAQDK